MNSGRGFLQVQVAIALAGAIALSGLAVTTYLHFREFNRLKVAEQQHLQDIATLTAANEVKDTELRLEREFANKRASLAESTASAIDKIRSETRQLINASRLAERASTEPGREDLNRRGAERWRQTYDAIYQASDWSDVYENIGSRSDRRD